MVLHTFPRPVLGAMLWGRPRRLVRIRTALSKLLHALVVVSLVGSTAGLPPQGAIAAPRTDHGPRTTDDTRPRPSTVHGPPSTLDGLPSSVQPPSAQSQGGRLWAGTNDAGVWLYADGAWTQRSEGLGNVRIRSLAVDPFDHNVLIASTPDAVFRTVDGGLHWSQLTMPYRQNGWGTVTFDRASPGDAVIGGPDLGTVFNTDPRAAVSHDDGATWTGVDLDVGEGKIAEAWLSDVWGFDGQWIIMGNSYHNIVLGWPCHRQAFWRSTNHGRSWQLSCTWNRDYWSITNHVTGLWTDPNHFFGGFDHAVTNPVVESLDGGGTWRVGGQYFSAQWLIAADPVRIDTVWLETGTNLWSSYRDVNGFQLRLNGLANGLPINVFAVDGYAGAIYVGGESRAMAYSRDGGSTWTPQPLPLGDPVHLGTAIIALAAEQPPSPPLPKRSDLSECRPKGGAGDERECQVNGASLAQGYAGDPIQTLSGAFDTFSLPAQNGGANGDLSINTSAGPLAFQRNYSSQATDLYTSTLGYGWTHNHDTRLIFPAPGSGSDTVWFKGHTANQYRFIVQDDGSYKPDFGVLASLERRPDPPLRYVLTNRAGQVYTFDEAGRLLRWQDALGHGWNYQYPAQNGGANGDGNARLLRVSDDSGSRYLTFAYDGQGRLTSVSDNGGRNVGFGYNAAGDLTSFRDATGNSWSYAYDAHRLTRINDPRGVASVRVEYSAENGGANGDAQGRAARQFDGLGNRTAEVVYADPAQNGGANGGTTRITDALGNTTTHVYDLVRRTLAREVDALGGTTDRSYDLNFRPTTITDPLGRTTRMVWSADGANLEQVIDPAGGVTTMAFGPGNHLERLTDALLRSTGFTYDGARLVRTTDPLNNAASYTYTTLADAPQPADLLKSATDARQRTTSFVYNPSGDRTSVLDAAGKAWTYAYDDRGLLTQATDPQGTITRYAYDAAGRLARVTLNHDPARPPNDRNLYNLATEFRYDPVGNLTDRIDPTGRVTHFEVDAADRLVAVTENYRPGFVPDEETNVRTQFVYDAAGNRIATVDPMGRITRVYYDALARPTVVVENLRGWEIANPAPPPFDPARPDQNVRASYAYDAASQRITVQDAAGRLLRTCYDARGLPVKAALNPTVADPCPGYSPSGDTARDILREWRYDAVGNLLRATDPGGFVSTFTYDALNRPLSASDPLGNTTLYAYNAVGERASTTDAEGVVTRYEYDGMGRLSAVVENFQLAGPSDAQTNVRSEFGYDALGDRVLFRDPNGGTWVSGYDALGRLTSQTDPLGHATSYAYDALGNVIAKTDALGFSTGFAYDPLDRLVVINYPAPDAEVIFMYDSRGDLLAATNSLGTTALRYDGLSRPVEVRFTFAQTVGYAYDAVGNRTRLTYADGRAPTSLARRTGHAGSGDPAGRAVDYAYDAAGRLAQARDWDRGLTAYTYDKRGLPATTRLPDGVTTTYAWDAAGRLTDLDHAFGSQTIAAYDYAYDRRGNRTRALESLVPAGWAPDLPYKVYLPLVLQNAGPGLAPSGVAPSAATTIDYAYDPLGRLVSADYSSGEFFHYGYDATGNRLSERTHQGETLYTYDAAQRLTSAGGVAYTWDANGNLLSDGERTYTYDHADRLSSVVRGVSSVRFAYNGLGARQQTTVDGNVTLYALDQVSGLTQVLSDGATAYLYGQGRTGEEGPAGWSYHLADGLGSARQLAGPVGAIARTQSFAPFGALLSATGEGSSAFGFAGEQGDPSGLVYLRARYYDPGTGRFLTKDPFPGFASLPATLNPYLYVLNNPVNWVDPSGEIIPLLLALGIGALVGGVGGGIHYALTHPGTDLGDLLSSGCFWREVGIGAAAGAVSGLLTGFLGGIGILGTGFWGTVGLGAIGGGVSGLVTEGLGQLLAFGRIVDPGALLWATGGGAVGGAVFAGIGYGLGQAFRSPTGVRAAPHPGSVRASSPDFVGTPSGDLIAIPEGARGPVPASNARGFRFEGGSGGHGLDPRTTGVRIMDPTPPVGPSPGYPRGYVSYYNELGQTVNPYTGQTIARANPWWHIPIR